MLCKSSKACRKIAYGVVALIAMTSSAFALNPFVTTNYAADPSAHVFEGRIYVYPSHDRTDAKEYDMTDYHVYSTDDLQNWQDHGVALDVKDVPWGLSHMWAPDCAYKNGTYYFVFCPRPRPPLMGRPIGIATSTNPGGPFTARPKPIDGCNGIDPSIFIDDDGTPYLIWAGKGCQGLKLKPDMSAFDGKPIQIQGLHNFFEGPWLFKRDGKYYMTYPARMKGGSGDGGSGQYFDYAIGDSPLGPYKYMGHFGQSRGGGNIHGSQVEYQGKWYNFYHDFSISKGVPKSGFKRGIRVEEMTFNPDGTIVPMVMTDAGPKQLKWLDPFNNCEAECLAQCDIPSGPHAITTAGHAGETVYLTQIDNGDWARYAGVDFGQGATAFTARVASTHAECTIELHLDTLDGPIIGTCPVPNTGNKDAWQDAHCAIHGAAGVHDLFMKFIGPASENKPAGGSADLFEFDAYHFTK